jgi:TfoX/Sxy family transcriptional regulator of competence genes
MKGESMASSKDYLEFIMEQLSGLEGVTYRAMMGEYIIYCKGVVVGGIYDDRFLVKNVDGVAELLPDAELALPYKGGKEMILVDDVENKEQLRDLINIIYNYLKK